MSQYYQGSLTIKSMILRNLFYHFAVFFDFLWSDKNGNDNRLDTAAILMESWLRQQLYHADMPPVAVPPLSSWQLRIFIYSSTLTPVSLTRAVSQPVNQLQLLSRTWPVKTQQAPNSDCLSRGRMHPSNKMSPDGRIYGADATLAPIQNNPYTELMASFRRAMGQSPIFKLPKIFGLLILVRKYKILA